MTENPSESQGPGKSPQKFSGRRFHKRQFQECRPYDGQQQDGPLVVHDNQPGNGPAQPEAEAYRLLTADGREAAMLPQ
jgi:hypothetical protein